MNNNLSINEYFSAFDELETLYPRVLPLTMWRAWELAIYRRFKLLSPALDLGCGDGRFLRQVWPDYRGNVVGVDIDSRAVEMARESNVYQRVHLSAAHTIPEPGEAFEMVFSNCAMEHMDSINEVVAEANRVLKPGGKFLFSVVTNHLIEWSPLPPFLGVLGLPEQSEKLTNGYLEYHHLVNPFSAEQWSNILSDNGFQILEYFPIAPDAFARVFIILDQLWHVPYHSSEIGEPVLQYFKELPNFSDGIKDIITGLWKLSMNTGQGAGAIFYAEKRK